MSKKKIPHSLTDGYSINILSNDENSSKAEFSDTEDITDTNNSNTSRSSLLANSIDLNDDDDNDIKKGCNDNL